MNLSKACEHRVGDAGILAPYSCKSTYNNQVKREYAIIHRLVFENAHLVQGDGGFGILNVN